MSRQSAAEIAGRRGSKVGLGLSLLGAMLLVLSVVLPCFSAKFVRGNAFGGVVKQGFVLKQICDVSGNDCSWTRQVRTWRLGDRYWMWVLLGRAVFALAFTSALAISVTAIRFRKRAPSAAQALRAKLIAWCSIAATLVGAALWLGPAWPPILTNVFDRTPASGSAAMLLGAVSAALGSYLVTRRSQSAA